MRLICAFLAAVLGGLSVAAPPVATAPPAFDPAVVKTALTELASPDYRTREAASRRLELAGDRALPAVRTALKTPHPPEAARRLEVLAERLLITSLKSPRRVSLTADKMSLREALKVFTTQTGYTFNTAVNGPGSDQNDVPVTVTLKDVPFLEALDRLCDANDLCHSNQTNDGVINITNQNTIDACKTYAGPFRVTLSSISRSNHLQLSGQPRRRPPTRVLDSLGVQFVVESEPKAAMLRLDQVEFLGATANRGDKIHAKPNSGDEEEFRSSYYYGGGEQRSFSQNGYFQIYPVYRKTESLAELRLRLRVLLIADTRVMAQCDVKNPAKSKDAKLVGRDASFTVTSAEMSDGELTVHLDVKYTGPANESYERHGWVYSYAQRLQAVDKSGELVPMSNWDVTDLGDSAKLQVNYTNTGRRANRPVTLRLVEWETRPQQVEVTFRNVPLP